MLILGAHLSSSKGYVHMLREAQSIGANTFQFFTRNPRGGAVKAQDPADVAAFLQGAQAADFGTVLAHAPYTMNMCSDKERTRTFAREVFADDLQRLEALPGTLYNFHPGSHVGQGTDNGIAYITQALNDLLTARETMYAQELTVEQACKAYKISDTRYRAGAGTILELNSAQLSQTQAQLNFSQAIYDYLSAKAEYDRIVGREHGNK